MGKVFKQYNCKQEKKNKIPTNQKLQQQKKKNTKAKPKGVSLIEVLHFMTFLKNLLI